MHAGTDVNALDGRGVSPLHLAYSRLRLARRSDDAGGEALSRKREMSGIVEMLREYLTLTDSGREETDELDELASKLSLSDTPQQVRGQGSLRYCSNMPFSHALFLRPVITKGSSTH